MEEKHLKNRCIGEISPIFHLFTFGISGSEKVKQVKTPFRVSPFHLFTECPNTFTFLAREFLNKKLGRCPYEL